MKFWYNDILYCVFKKREELDNHLIKINRDYVLPDFKLEVGRYYLNRSIYTLLDTTQVAEHIANGSKILLAYEVLFKEEDIDGLAYEFFTGEVVDLIQKLERYKKYRIKYENNSGRFNFRILESKEETENDVWYRISSIKDVSKIKFIYW